VVSGERYQREFVFGEGAAMVAKEEFGWESVLAFADDFVAVVESRAGAVEGTSHDNAGGGSATQERSHSVDITGPGQAIKRQLVGGYPRDVFPFEIGGSDSLSAESGITPLVPFVESAHEEAAAEVHA